MATKCDAMESVHSDLARDIAVESVHSDLVRDVAPDVLCGDCKGCVLEDTECVARAVNVMLGSTKTLLDLRASSSLTPTTEGSLTPATDESIMPTDGSLTPATDGSELLSVPRSADGWV